MPTPTFEAALAEMHRLLCVAQGPPPEDERVTNVAALLIFPRLSKPPPNVLANGGAGAHNSRCNLIAPSGESEACHG